MTQQADLVAASRAHGVRDPRLLEAIAKVPRAQFVPTALAAHAYRDEPLPIPRGQVTTQPSLVAQMVEALELSSSDRVLEIGTEVVLFEKRGGVLERTRHVTGAHFVRLFGEHGFVP
jgi:protein-L-isoaspartate O-methyltransferase